MTDDQGRTFWTDRRISNAVVVMIVLLAAVAVGSGKLIDRSNHNSPLIANTAKTLNLVVDCTQPPHFRHVKPKNLTCYERGQASTATVLEILGQATRDANAVAVYCASHVPTGDVATIKACVDGEFAKLHPPQPASAHG